MSGCLTLISFHCQVVPYYGYARADRKSQGRESIAAKLTANIITEAGASRVLAMDLHSGQCVGYFDIPVSCRLFLGCCLAVRRVAW
jgi:phosphoribosylpyrophosphate synthetase